MENDTTIIMEAVEVIRNYVSAVKGRTPANAEIAQALKRYFVLKEIADGIDLPEEGD